MKRLLIIILSVILCITGIVAGYVIINIKHIQSDSVLAHLKYGMTDEEVLNLVSNPRLTSSGRTGYEFELPDGRGCVVYFNRGLGYVFVEETKGEFAGYGFEYDLDKQELIPPFLPDSLIGIQYGMTVEEIEKIFRGDSQQNVSFLGLEHSHKIAISHRPNQHTEPDLDVYLIRLSTGEWVNLVFETIWSESKWKKQLLYVYMKADDGEWYVYDLDTQELTEERVPKESVWEKNRRADIQKP